MSPPRKPKDPATKPNTNILARSIQNEESPLYVAGKMFAIRPEKRVTDSLLLMEKSGTIVERFVYLHGDIVGLNQAQRIQAAMTQALGDIAAENAMLRTVRDSAARLIDHQKSGKRGKDLAPFGMALIESVGPLIAVN